MMIDCMCDSGWMASTSCLAQSSRAWM